MTDTANNPPCPICGGIGLVTHDVPLGHPDFGKAFPCVCQADVVKARQASRLRTLGNLDAYIDKTFNTFEIDFALIEPQDAYLCQIFRDMDQTRKLSLTEEHRRKISIAAELALRFAEKPDGWLLLEGNFGTGKTHLAAAIGNWRLNYGDPVLFITVPDLLDHLRGTFGPSSEIAYDELFERIRKAPLLLLDDLGAEHQSGWAVEKLYQLFNDRHHLRLPTVITTNRDPALIEPRIRSRLLDNELTRSLKLTIPDRRSPVTTWQEADLSNLDRYRDMTFETFEPRTGEDLKGEDVQRLQTTIQVARSFAENPEGWLILMGAAGTGKTHLAAAIAHICNRRGMRTLFVTTSDLLDHLRRTFAPDSAVSYDKRMEEIKGAPVLVLDDLAVQGKSFSSWASEKLYDILTYRFDYNLPTVITTLQALQDMAERLRSRIGNESRSHVEAITAPYYPGKPQRNRRAAPPRRLR
jgi:DNA replication protein DnaC